MNNRVALLDTKKGNTRSVFTAEDYVSWIGAAGKLRGRKSGDSDGDESSGEMGKREP